MATAAQQLDAIRNLTENWDGYGGAAPRGEIVDAAKGIAGLIETALRRSASVPLQISPTRIGGILIEWDDPATEHEIEIHPDNSLGFLHRHKATGEIVTRTIAPFSIQLEFLQELQQLIAA